MCSLHYTTLALRLLSCWCWVLLSIFESCYSQHSPEEGTNCDIIFQDDIPANVNLQYGSSTVRLTEVVITVY